MSNLTNVYAFLRNNYSDLDIHFGKPSSYIKTLNGIKNQKIIFIYKEDRSKLIHHSSPVTDNDKSGSTNLSVGGSPLKDDNSINNLINTSIANKLFISKPWSDLEECHTGISIDLARDIMFSLVNHKFPENTYGWIFILCANSQQPQSSLDSPFLLSFCKTSGQFTRGITKYHGAIKGEEKSMSSLLQKHDSTSRAEINIESIFEVSMDLSLRFFNKYSGETQMPSLTSHIDNRSEITLYQRIEIGKSHVLCESFWDEIKLLHMIKNDITSVKNETYDGSLLEPCFNYGMRSFEEMQKDVNHILMDVISSTSESLSNDENSTDSHLEAVLKRADMRVLTDMTDQLWQVLKNSSSYNDLKKILSFIFQISSRSCIVNIPMNENRLSELIRELSQQRLAVPNLTSTEPLELLLEIGIEKVMKDYEFIFTESKICNLKDIAVGEKRTDVKSEETTGITNIRKSLAPSSEIGQSARKTLLRGTDSLESNKDDDYGFYNSRFNEKTVDISISKLAQIHLTIEHILMIQNNLDMNHDYTAIAKKLLSSPLLPFDELQAKKYDRLDIAISDEKVLSLVENLVPNSQKIKVKSENKFRVTESTFYFNIEQIVPILAQKEKEYDVIDNKKGDTFHFISYKSVVSKF